DMTDNSNRVSDEVIWKNSNLNRIRLVTEDIRSIVSNIFSIRRRPGNDNYTYTSPIDPKRPDGGSSGGIINIINDTRNIIDNSVDSTVVNNNGSKVFNTFNEIVNNDGNSPMEIINNITSLFTKSDTLDNTSGIIDNSINISPVSTIMENLPMNENQSSDVELSNSQVEMDTQSTVNLNMDTPEQTESYADFSEIEG